AAGRAAVCFVATEYGEIVMKPHPLCEIRQGRLTPDRMRETFEAEDPQYIVDATHPYAVEVTANIRRAAEEAGMADRYLRLSREREAADEALLARFPDCEIVPDAETAAARCCALPGHVFLTTGVRELAKFMAHEELADRITARILPSMDSLRIAAESGIRSGALICMEGPFDTEINVALFRRTNARVMVTKNSGARGGFEEKLEAARRCGIHTIIIDSGVKDRGMSGEEILALLGIETADDAAGNAASAQSPADGAENASEDAPEICIVGIGVGKRELLTGEALAAIERADVLIGAARMLEFASQINPRAKAFREYAPEKAAEILRTETYGAACVLMSGDTGFFSGAAGVRAALEKEGRAVRLVPGISSLVYFAAKTGIPYSEASVISLHGQDTDVESAVLARDRLFSILTGPADIARVCAEVCRLRGNARVFVGKDLGSADETFWEFDAAETPAFPEKGLYIMAVTDYGR
ncbi:MAG: precorrin-6y C5,15-methyltransferase (decarboxylating) subunit CbiE, partial [Lachnospiraceae bacterium]|nr:precorrin-6y C5,15-methyltransferase (decarboxylating) subunit CbiE [Lachnospiraceae bacterium]